jgi:hypothetical protein
LSHVRFLNSKCTSDLLTDSSRFRPLAHWGRGGHGVSVSTRRLVASRLALHDRPFSGVAPGRCHACTSLTPQQTLPTPQPHTYPGPLRQGYPQCGYNHFVSHLSPSQAPPPPSTATHLSFSSPTDPETNARVDPSCPLSPTLLCHTAGTLCSPSRCGGLASAASCDPGSPAIRVFFARLATAHLTVVLKPCGCYS